MGEEDQNLKYRPTNAELSPPLTSNQPWSGLQAAQSLKWTTGAERDSSGKALELWPEEREGTLNGQRNLGKSPSYTSSIFSQPGIQAILLCWQQQ